MSPGVPRLALLREGSRVSAPMGHRLALLQLDSREGGAP